MKKIRCLSFLMICLLAKSSVYATECCCGGVEMDCLASSCSVSDGENCEVVPQGKQRGASGEFLKGHLTEEELIQKMSPDVKEAYDKLSPQGKMFILQIVNKTGQLKNLGPIIKDTLKRFSDKKQQPSE